jgi:hypothetical protein
MIAAKQHSTLTDTTIVPDCYLTKIIDPRILTNPTAIANR